MRNLKLPFSFFLVALLAGCALFGPQPETLNERLAYAYAAHAAVQQGAANSVNAGDLSSADGQQVLELADESRTLLDASRAALTGGDTSTAEGKLALGTSILEQLQAYLRRGR